MMLIKVIPSFKILHFLHKNKTLKEYKKIRCIRKLKHTFSGKLSKFVLTGSRQPNLDDLYRLIMSCNVAATMKYSCLSLNSLPSKN